MKTYGEMNSELETGEPQR